MKTRKDVESAPPESAHRWEESGLAGKLGPAFLLLGRLVNRRLEVALADAGLGLTPAQARSLAMLWFHGPMSQQSLAAHTEVEPSTLVKTLDVMERDGLARRDRNPADRRAYLVHLTPRGERLVPRLIGLWDEVESELVEGLSARDQATLRELVSRCIAGLSAWETPCG